MDRRLLRLRFVHLLCLRIVHLLGLRFVHLFRLCLRLRFLHPRLN